MKSFLPIIFLFLLIGCKNDPKPDKIEDDIAPSERDSVRVSEKDIHSYERFFELKRKELLEKKDQKTELENLVASKTFYKEADKFTMDFNYPYLNEKIDPRYANFNEYVSKHLLNTENVKKEVQEEKNRCDAMGTPTETGKRVVEYKIFNLNDRLISVLFYKENHHTDELGANYTFETLNFNLEESYFMDYEDFFNQGTEEELVEILNGLLKEKINSGEMYYDCWTISDDDFFAYKNNFVITDNAVEYYFDDCVICPSYTGTYSISVPLEMLMPVLRKNGRKLFNF